MTTFYFQEIKTKSTILQNSMWMLWISLAVINLINWFNTSNKSNLFSAVCFLLAAIINLVVKKKQVKSYIAVLNNGVEWIEPNNGEKGNNLTPLILKWTEIRRIKFEDEGVSLYQESSFNNFISLKKLTDSDKIECVNEIANHSKTHSIELIR